MNDRQAEFFARYLRKVPGVVRWIIWLGWVYFFILLAQRLGA